MRFFAIGLLLPLTLITACGDQTNFKSASSGGAAVPSANSTAGTGGVSDPSTEANAVATEPGANIAGSNEPGATGDGTDAPSGGDGTDGSSTGGGSSSSGGGNEVFVAATKVGVNFEDMQGPQSDHDYNDAVLCFTGGFDVSASHIISNVDQSIPATVFSASSCEKTIEIDIYRGDQLVSQSIVNPRTTNAATLNFMKGDRLEVSMTTSSAPCDTDGVAHKMTEASWAIFTANQCNDSGN